MSRLPISICMIGKNEERYLEECLQRLMEYEAEIVFVDTGSTDQTKEIAKKYTDKVYDFVWIDDFSAARNFATSKASNNWILALDCDEYIMNMDVRMLRVYMQQHLRHVGMMEMKNLYKNDKGVQTYRIDPVPRFYNKNFFEYRFRIHEQITPKDAEDLSQVKLLTYKLPMEVVHHGYNITPEEMGRKQARNLKMLESAIGETPFDDYIYFQIGQSYASLHQFDHAAKAYLECIQINDNFEKYFMKQAIISYSKVLHELGRYEDEVNMMLHFEDRIQTAEFMFLLGRAFQATGDQLKALLTYVKVTQMPDFDSLGEDAYETFIRIMTLHSANGNMEGLLHFKERMADYGKRHGREIVFN